MRRRFVYLVLALALLWAPAMARAQAVLGAPSGSPAGCTWSVTTYGGVGVQTSNVACLASYSHVMYAGAAMGGSPTAVISPGQAGTTPIVNVNCAITAAGSTTVGCLSPAGAATTIVYGFAW